MEEDSGARGHSQALDDALQLDGLAPEGVVSAVAPGRPHHLGPLVPHDRVGWEKEKEKNDKQGGVGEKDSHKCKESFSADTPATVEALTPARGQVTFPHLTSQPVLVFFVFPKRRIERSHVNMRFTL